MKKEYIQPRMKVVKVQANQMLCGSPSFSIYEDDGQEYDAE